MNDSTNKTEVVQFRLTLDQLELLDKSYKHYLSTNKDVITRAEYIRQIVMIACLKEVGLVSIGRPIEDCGCSEIYQSHRCGKK